MNLGIKSITTKFLISFLIFVLIVGGIFYGLGYKGVEVFPLSVVIGVVGALFIYVLITFFFLVLKPLRTIVAQVQFVLAGKKFKKIFTARVDEIGLLAHFFNQVTSGFTKVVSDIKDRKRILDELSVAVELQKSIFPAEAPKVDGLSIVAKNTPATEIGGDSYDFIDSKDNLYVYIGDVTGHGVTAGLIMAMVNSMINSFAEFFNSALEIVVAANKHIKKYVKPSMYMTLVMLSFNKKTQKLSYVGAGHEHILVYRKGTGQVEDIVSGGTALGMVPDVSKTLQEREIPLVKGDMVVLYSDGVTEAKNKEGALYGLEKLKSALIEYGSQYSASGVNYHISTDLAAFVGDESQLDDITLIVLEKL